MQGFSLGLNVEGGHVVGEGSIVKWWPFGSGDSYCCWGG